MWVCCDLNSIVLPSRRTASHTCQLYRLIHNFLPFTNSCNFQKVGYCYRAVARKVQFNNPLSYGKPPVGGGEEWHIDFCPLMEWNDKKNSQTRRPTSCNRNDKTARFTWTLRPTVGKSPFVFINNVFPLTVRHQSRRGKLKIKILLIVAAIYDSILAWQFDSTHKRAVLTAHRWFPVWPA